MVEVAVHNDGLDHSLRTFKREVQREGISRVMKITYHEKPSEKKKRKRAESERRRRKLRAKIFQNDSQSSKYSKGSKRW